MGVAFAASAGADAMLGAGADEQWRVAAFRRSVRTGLLLFAGFSVLALLVRLGAFQAPDAETVLRVYKGGGRTGDTVDAPDLQLRRP